jgi:hypothetical protein
MEGFYPIHVLLSDTYDQKQHMERGIVFCVAAMGRRNYKGSVTKYLIFFNAVMYLILHQTICLKPQLLQSQYGTNLVLNHNSCIGTIANEFKLSPQK